MPAFFSNMISNPMFNVIIKQDNNNRIFKKDIEILQDKGS